MKCPICGKECRKGIADALGNLTQLRWYPEDRKNKFIKKEAYILKLRAKGITAMSV